MKSILTLFLVLFQVLVFGQFDSFKIYKPHSPDYSKTIYPKGNGITYNLYIGETIAGYTIANGWRQDSINGGFNKEIYNNPYVASNGEYVGFEKQVYDRDFVFYRYKDGKKYSGKIIDTLNLRYTPPVAVGMLYGNPYYESKNIKVIFTANFVNGLIQGVGKLTTLNLEELISNCYFENGEIVGEIISRGIYSNNIYKKHYEKGKVNYISQTETDKDGNEIAPSNKEKFSFKETYLNLLDPYRFLDQKEKARQIFINNTHPNFYNPLFIEPIDLMLYYFSHIINFQEPNKKYNTKYFQVSVFNYGDYKIVLCSFNQLIRGKYSSVLECYDKLGRLIIVRYQNVHFEAVSDLKYYTKFYDIIGYGDLLTVFTYDDNGNINNASKYEGVYENDINLMCNYDDDFKTKMLSNLYFKPTSIIYQNEVRTSENKN